MPCQTCGATLADKSITARFCSSKCRSDMHNLRRVRGDQIYDLLMARASSYKNRKLITDIDRMVRAWLVDDKKRNIVSHRVAR